MMKAQYLNTRHILIYYLRKLMAHSFADRKQYLNPALDDLHYNTAFGTYSLQFPITTT